MPERLAVLIQYLLPKLALTVIAGRFARLRGGRATTWVIRWFVRRYAVNMEEAANPDIASYETFNDFFTRPLRDGVRPVQAAQLVCPVDGAISQFGAIEQDQIYQAKGHHYCTTTLVGGDRELAAHFYDGQFATLYLSPKDYHRIHMPCDGRLTQMIYVPGDLFSVNPVTARSVASLFARNERVVCVFETEYGPFVMTLVGATIVGSMATVWHGTVNPTRTGEICKWRYREEVISLKQGDELGRFKLGSTVVMLFPAGAPPFTSAWAPQRAVQMGEAMSEPCIEATSAPEQIQALTTDS